jgi:hypothetical protein
VAFHPEFLARGSGVPETAWPWLEEPLEKARGNPDPTPRPLRRL